MEEGDCARLFKEEFNRKSTTDAAVAWNPAISAFAFAYSF
jgi:hypothetical protein